ncbi:MAG: hypothetical protein WEB60_09845, partial [Terrimicrobiaceae bacterium]
EEEAGKDADDGDHDEEFNQSECVSAGVHDIFTLVLDDDFGKQIVPVWGRWGRGLGGRSRRQRREEVMFLTGPFFMGPFGD